MNSTTMQYVECESRAQRLRREAFEQIQTVRAQRKGRAAIERYVEHLEDQQQAAVARAMKSSAGWWRNINNRLDCLKRAWAANGGPQPEIDEGVATSPLERFILSHPSVYHSALFAWCWESPTASEPGGATVMDLLLGYESAKASADAFQGAARAICLHPMVLQSTKRTWDGTESTRCDACGELLHFPSVGISHRRGFVEQSEPKLAVVE